MAGNESQKRISPEEIARAHGLSFGGVIERTRKDVALPEFVEDPQIVAARENAVKLAQEADHRLLAAAAARLAATDTSTGD